MTSGNNDRDPLFLVTAGLTVLAMGVAAALSFQKQKQEWPQDWQGRTVCITGGNSGIGKAVAMNLGQRGARILMGCRNLDAARQVCSRLEHCQVFSVDLSSATSVEAFSENICRATASTGLHLLVNNAGAMMTKQEMSTSDGWDRTMAVNHLGWVQLTQNLWPLLERAAQEDTTQPVRVINVGSTLEKRASLPDNPDNPQDWNDWIQKSIDPFETFAAYANSKLAMTATTFYWAKLLQKKNKDQEKDKQVQMVIVSPGMVNTALPRFMPLWKRILSYPLRVALLKTPRQGADSILYAADDPNIESGDYIRNRQQIPNDSSSCSPAARNPRVAQHIWEATLRALEARRNASSK